MTADERNELAEMLNFLCREKSRLDRAERLWGHGPAADRAKQDLCRAKEEILVYIEKMVAQRRVTINETIGTIEEGSSVVGVKIGRLG